MSEVPSRPVLASLTRVNALPRWAVRAMPFAAVAAGFLLIVWGQYEVSRNPVDVPFTWPFLHGFKRWLARDVYHTRSAVAFALPLFIVGGAIVATLAPPVASTHLERWKPHVVLTRRRAVIITAALAPPVLVWAYILRGLAYHHYEPNYRWLMAAAVVWMLAALVAVDRSDGRISLPSLRWPHLIEAALVLALAGTFIGITARDLSSWRYSAIGDEGAYWDMAQRVIRGDPLNWFSQDGVYGYHPILGTVWYAETMRVFGSGLFGWKMGSVLAIVATFPMFYWLLRQLFGVRVAAFGTLVLAASHYLFSYAHTGYDNILAIFPATAALAFFVAGLRRSSYTLLFLAGFFAGFGWYTFYPSRSAIIILAAATLFMGRRGLRPEVIAAIGAGFLMCVLPIFAVNKWDVIHQMLIQSRSQSHQPFFEKITQNTPRTFLAFSFNPSNIHYTAGALLDSASFVLAVVGIAIAIRGIRHEGYRLIVIWWLVASVVTGLFSAYDFVTISRLHFVVPPMAAFAGIGIDRLIAATARVVDRASFERVVAVAAFAVLAPVLFIVNGRHFFIYSAHHSPTTVETVVVREFTAPACADQPLREITYWRDADSLLIGLWKFFGRADSMPVQISFANADAAYGPYPASGGTGCAAYPLSNDEKVKTLQQRLDPSVPASNRHVAADLTGEQRITVIQPEQRGLDAASLSRSWRTDLTKGVGLEGIVQGQERDFVDSIDAPEFGRPSTLGGVPDEPVVVVTHGAETRGYPVHTLLRHGPVNDVLDGIPIAVTFDPIAGAARVYERDAAGQTLAFGLTGLLRDGNGLLYDRATETWWQQVTGEAITGALAGTKLTPLPAIVGTLGEFARAYSDGTVLTNDFKDSAKAGNPYLGYDTPQGKPIFTAAPINDALAPMTRVAVIDVGGGQRPFAIPLPDASKGDQAFPIDAGGRPAVLLFDSGTLSLLDRTHAPESRHVGTVSAFLARDEAQARSFAALSQDSGLFQDGANITWDGYGRAVGADSQTLTPLSVTTGFWFSISSLYPGIQVVYP